MIVDTLFENLFIQIQQVITLGNQAHTKQSALGLKLNEPTENDLKNWNNILADVADSKKKLHLYVQNGIEQNRHSIDAELSTYRELPRRLAEGSSPEWSAYYPEIQKCIGDMYSTRVAIEKNTFLVSIKILEKNYERPKSSFI